MKRFVTTLLLAVLFVPITNAQQWVSFSNNDLYTPELNLLSSNTQTVSFTVTIPGIYKLDTLVNGTAFTRLMLPEGASVNFAGAPEIPVLTYRIATPKCSDISIVSNIISQQSLSSCLIYPVPQFFFEQNQEGFDVPVEQFSFDTTAYAQLRYDDEPVAIISSSGTFRVQQYVEVTICPVVYCPVTQQLSIIDEVEITLTFANSQGALRQNVGIFNKVATNAFINYEDDGISTLINDKAFTKANFTPGTVQWVTLTDTAQACQIVADYLIITDSTFFKPNNSSSQLNRLAYHRAYYNGFDVAILNVEEIISDDLGFYFEGNTITLQHPSPDACKKEQRIRTCIRRIYEGSNAQHTGDGKLGYVLLVGDVGEENTKMPISYDHHTPNPLPTQIEAPSDYYYSCITKNPMPPIPPIWDLYDTFGDMFIGRFSVQDDFHLYNMVQKTINHETVYSPDLWRKSAGFSNGKVDTPSSHQNMYNNWCNLLDNLGWNYSIVNYFDYAHLDDTLRQKTTRDSIIKFMNDGVVFVEYYGHGGIHWWQTINDQGFTDYLMNDFKTPFIFAGACQTGWIDGYNGSITNDDEDCMAEILTRYSPTKGAVCYVGASRTLSGDLTGIPTLLFKNGVSIVGELLLRHKYLSHPDGRYKYILFGDPALNILADCSSLLSTTKHVNNGETLTISCNLYCTGNAQIIVHPGGKLVVDGGTLTNACEGELWQGITVLGDSTQPLNKNDQGYVQLKNGATIENAYWGIYIEGGGIVSASNVQFVNNYYGVRFGPLAIGQSGVSGTFEKTKFITDDNYMGSSAFETHIMAESSGSIQIYECEFSSTAPQDLPPLSNNAIRTFNTDLLISVICKVPYPHNNCAYNISSKNIFSGFKRAIVSTNSGVFPILKIQHSQFNDNVSGITVNGINNHKITRNDFNFTPFNTIGIKVNNATGYKIEENNFKNTVSEFNTNIGLWIDNSGIDENEVYKNTFFNLNKGQVCSGRNSSHLACNFSESDDSEKEELLSGLQIYCSTFNNSQSEDIMVGFFPLSLNTIRKFQGSTQHATGNLFYEMPVINIDNSISQCDISYYYGFQSNEYPGNVTNVTRISASSTNGCSNRNGYYSDEPDEPENELEDDESEDLDEFIERALAQYDKWNAEYEYWLEKLIATEVNSEEYNIILNEVSYYSALKDNYFNKIVVDVMNADNYNSPPPAGAGGGNTTNYETLRYLFSYRGHYVDNLSIVETYMAESSYATALSSLSKVYEQFEITKAQSTELKGLETYIHWLQQLEDKKNNIYKLPESEIEYLINFVKADSGRGVVFAHNILCELYEICLEKDAEGGEQKAGSNEEEINQRKSVSSVLSVCKKALENVTVAPNPTTGQIKIESGELKIENAEVYDIFGKNLSSHPHISSSSNYEIDISNLSTGLYFVKIKTEMGEVVKKVVKQ